MIKLVGLLNSVPVRELSTGGATHITQTGVKASIDDIHEVARTILAATF